MRWVTDMRTSPISLSRRLTPALLVVVLLIPVSCFGQNAPAITLPKPRMEGGKPLMQALKDRQSARQFGVQKLPPQVLSDLLWAAWGVNRSDGRRTAPSAVNSQEIDIYITLAEGVYLFDPRSHTLKPVLAGDHRALAGSQAFVAQAPLNLVYVSDYAKMGSTKPELKPAWTAANTGFIGQNVYLFCASEGLVTVFRAMLDGEALGRALSLRPDQHVTFSQTVGYPQK